MFRTRSLLSFVLMVGTFAGSLIDGVWIERELDADEPALAAATSTAADDPRPNVVLIMTDNHGAWTLGCYGNQDIRTPNIDRLARDGTLLECAFASNPVCSPTRATTLTGLIPSQHGVHCFLHAGRLQMGPAARNTLDRFTSLPEVLKENGYRCGLVGKWHLGANMTPQEGFDDYWVTMPHGGTSTFYGAQVIENGALRKEPEYLTDFWTRHAIDFIKGKRSGDRRQASTERSDKPFFLYLAYNGPYALSRLLVREGKNRHAAYYRDQPLPSFPREPAHPWQLHNLDYINNPVSIGRVATEISGVDDGVGAVIDALHDQGLDDNTIVIFMADQGWVGGHGGFFGMGDHTQPVTARDGMMKIPLIWRFPKKIAAGQRSKKLVANYDIMPTLLDLMGIDPPKHPDEPQSPGRSFAAELTSEHVVAKTDDAVFYEFEALRCVRTQDWKYVHRHPNGPDELYDLKNDPDEFTNRVHDPDHAARLDQLKHRLDTFFTTYASPQYDLYHAGTSQTVLYRGVQEEIAQTPAGDPPPSDAGFVPQSFLLPDGFSARLVAGPPLVNHPTMGCFDDRGRLFLADGAGVNLSAQELEQQLPNHIKMLEDTDGDGRFDKSTIFADKMTFPMGAAWHDGALYVASPPNIWRLQDTDGDGVADQRDILVDKFGYTGNAASIHGCFASPDGRLYWCDGYHGHEFKDRDGQVTSRRKASYLFSCQADGSDVRIHCGGGMDNPVEVDFTDTGDVIGTVNIMYTRPRNDCLVHWQPGGAYPHREAFLDEWPVTGELLGPIHRFGHVAVSGTTRYRSGVMNHRWRDNFFATEFNLGKVVRLELKPVGSSFSVTERQFLSSNSHDFHPTDVIEDADGSLLVVDTGGWFYRGCPTSQIAKPDILGGVYRIGRDGMTTVPDPRGNRINWSRLSHKQLIQTLGDTRFAVREKAIGQCVDRGLPIVAPLATAVKSADIVIRKNALWALTRILPSLTRADKYAARDDAARGDAARDVAASKELAGKDAARDVAASKIDAVQAATARATGRATIVKALRAALSDPDASIRQVACHIARQHALHELTGDLIATANDPQPAVVRESLSALGRIKDNKAMPVLLQSLADDDRELSHAAAWAMLQFGQELEIPWDQLDPSDASTLVLAQLVQLQTAPDPALLARTLAMPWPDEPSLQRQWIRNGSLALKHSQRLGQRQETELALATKFTQLVPRYAAGRIAVAQLDEFIMRFATLGPVSERIGATLADPATNVALRAAILAAVAKAKIPLHESWVAPLIADLDSGDADRFHQGLVAIAATPSPLFESRLRDIAADAKRTSAQRLLATSGLLAIRRSLSDALFTMLVERAQGGPTESGTACQLLGTAELTASQLTAIAALLPKVSPQHLNDLVPLFKRQLAVDQAAALLDGLENARSLNSLALSDVSDVVKSFPPELHARTQRLLDKMKSAEQAKLSKLDTLIGLLQSGDAARGRKVFFSDQAKCSSCHVIASSATTTDSGEALGKRVGPDLTTIGANRSAQDLLESILFPSATIVRQYEPYTLVTVDGRSYSGLVIKDTSDEVSIQQSSGETVTIARDEMESLIPSTVSIMPQGLDESLTPQQIADLVTWLQTLKGGAAR